MTEAEKRKEAITLGWRILESKYIYYCLGGEHPLAINDAEYDRMERKYQALCKELNMEPSASNMVGFSKSKPSCQLVMEVMDAIKSEKRREQPVQENLMGRRAD